MQSIQPLHLHQHRPPALGLMQPRVHPQWRAKKVGNSLSCLLCCSCMVLLHVTCKSLTALLSLLGLSFLPSSPLPTFSMHADVTPCLSLIFLLLLLSSWL